MRKQSKKTINLANLLEWQASGRGVLISSLLPSTGAQGSEQRHFIVRQRGRILRQAVLYNYNDKSSKKQVKETVPTWSQNWLLCNKTYKHV